ncbi:MAG: sigma-70 family RNA polymerase sigma factor [Arenimonas sp.]
MESHGEGRTMGTVGPFPGTVVSLSEVLVPACETATGRDDGVEWGAWMTAAQLGDRQAYHAVLVGIAPYLRSIARRLLGQEQDAEDMVQEILIVVHDIRHTYEPGRPFKPWLSTIATRRCIDHLRRRTRRLQHEIAEDGDLEFASSGHESPEDRIGRNHSDRVLHDAVDALPNRQREAIRLLRLQELTLNEAAARSEQSIGSLKVACHRAIKGLRRALAHKEPT